MKSLLEDTKAVHFSILLSALWMKKFLLLAWIEFWLTVQPLGYQQPSSEGNFLHTAVTNLLPEEEASLLVSHIPQTETETLNLNHQ